MRHKKIFLYSFITFAVSIFNYELITLQFAAVRNVSTACVGWWIVRLLIIYWFQFWIFPSEIQRFLFAHNILIQFIKKVITDIRDELKIEDAPKIWMKDTEPLILRAPGSKEILSALQTVRSTLENGFSKVNQEWKCDGKSSISMQFFRSKCWLLTVSADPWYLIKCPQFLFRAFLLICTN